MKDNLRRFEEASLYLRTVVRVFPDYADTVIWFAPGPIDYDEAHISSELAGAMRRWEQDYYDGVGDAYEWTSKTAETRHADIGMTLARALSEEIGDQLEVEVDDAAGNKVRLRSPGKPTNRAAAQAFRTMAEQAAAADAQSAEMIRSGRRFDLRAMGPSPE